MLCCCWMKMSTETGYLFSQRTHFFFKLFLALINRDIIKPVFLLGKWNSSLLSSKMEEQRAKPSLKWNFLGSWHRSNTQPLHSVIVNKLLLEPNCWCTLNFWILLNHICLYAAAVLILSSLDLFMIAIETTWRCIFHQTHSNNSVVVCIFSISMAHFRFSSQYECPYHFFKPTSVN